MRVLVTGGAGFIGSHVVDALVAAGHEVAVLDNLSFGERSLVSPEARFFLADITDEQRAEKAFETFRPEVVCHHAAQVNVRSSLRDPIHDAQTNVLGSLAILRLAAHFDVAKVIYASSGGAMYGEPTYLPVREDHPIRPLSPYGISKQTVEHYLQMYTSLTGMDYTVLRYANVYGPRQGLRGEAGVIAIFINRLLAGETCTIYGDGTQSRDFVYVGDVAAANLRALTQGNGLALNIGTGNSVSVHEIYDSLCEILGVKELPQYAPAPAGEVRHIALDPGAAHRSLGWRPQVSLADGLAITAEAIRLRTPAGNS